MLDNLFTLQSCADLEVGAPLPFLHDQNYYYKLFNTVCGAQLLDGDPLIPVYQSFRGSFDLEERSMSSMSSSLAYIANECVQNINEHISRNLEPIFCRMLRLHARRSNFENQNEEILRKICKHVYKRLGGMLTFWPTSVPRTQERIDLAENLYEEYIAWFGALWVESNDLPDSNNGESDDEIEIDEVLVLGVEQAVFDQQEYNPNHDRGDDSDSELGDDSDPEVDLDDENDPNFVPEFLPGMNAYPDTIKEVI